AATLVATFQGCQTDGICYPPMTRRVRLELPAGKLSHTTEAAVANLVIPPLPSGKKNTASVTTRPESEPEPAPQPLVIRPNSEPAASTSAVDASADNSQRSQPPGTSEPASLLWILLLALAGGLILNLMPCVLDRK